MLKGGEMLQEVSCCVENSKPNNKKRNTNDGLHAMKNPNRRVQFWCFFAGRMPMVSDTVRDSLRDTSETKKQQKNKQLCKQLRFILGHLVTHAIAPKAHAHSCSTGQPPRGNTGQTLPR